MNTEKNWDEMSRAYENFTEDEDSYSYQIEWPCILKMLPRLKDKAVLDLGCGTGRFGFLFEQFEPSSIVGIDISEGMLAIGREKAANKGSKVIFQKGDLERLEDLPDDGFDFVFSSTSMHYISDLQSVFMNISRLLKVGGTCVLSIMHPVYTAQYPLSQNGRFPDDEEWTVRYLDGSERAYIQPWIEYNDAIDNFLSSSYHYTISQYINAITAAGLRIERVEEPCPPQSWVTKYPGRYESFINTPCYMIFSLHK
jgi:ubiquinone/menaquinone biosynthesis C-methylase UbiE